MTFNLVTTLAWWLLKKSIHSWARILNGLTWILWIVANGPASLLPLLEMYLQVIPEQFCKGTYGVCNKNWNHSNFNNRRLLKQIMIYPTDGILTGPSHLCYRFVFIDKHVHYLLLSRRLMKQYNSIIPFLFVKSIHTSEVWKDIC